MRDRDVFFAADRDALGAAVEQRRKSFRRSRSQRRGADHPELTQQVREYAAAHSLTSADALKEGMKEKSAEFKKAGEIYIKS